MLVFKLPANLQPQVLHSASKQNLLTFNISVFLNEAFIPKCLIAVTADTTGIDLL